MEMNINNVNAASALCEQLKELEGQYSLVVRGELSRRIGAVKHQLKELGITSFTKEQ